jgi:bacillithiol system protein YtxJ
VSLQDRTQFLTSPAEVDEFLSAHPIAVVFKAGNCHKSDETLARLPAALDPREDIPFGMIRVVEARAASDHVAARTGVRHESPQLLVFKAGELVLSRNHWDITAEALAAALGSRLAAV